MAFRKPRLPPLVVELLNPHHRTITTAVTAIAVQIGMGLAAPWPLMVVLDNIVGNDPIPPWISHTLVLLGVNGRTQMTAVIGASCIALAAVAAVAMYCANTRAERVGQAIGNSLRTRLYHHLQELSLAYYDTNRAGGILNTLTGDVQTIQNFASTSTTTIATDALSLIGMLAVMFLLRWDFALIALTATSLLALFALRVDKEARALVHNVRRRQSDLMATMQEGLQSIEMIKAFEGEHRQEQQVETVTAATATAWLHGRRMSGLQPPVITFLIAVCTGTVLWRGPLLVLSGAMTIGSLSIFLAYLTRFFQPVRNLAQMTTTIATVTVSFHRVTAVCDADKVIPERPIPKEPPPFRGEITFHKVSFSYQPGMLILRDITFNIRPGEMVGIVGPTGSGKTTVASLIPRFRDPDGGHIAIDGVNICEYTLHGLRSQIGFVLQDTVLLHASIASNIALGRPDATKDDIVRAAKLANADEFIQKLSNGYDSVVGDRGTTLSGGQRQCIGIARALIRNNPILILDEPTAALDAHTETIVAQSLNRLVEGRTVITIAHRLSTLRQADRILVIDDGVVVENGSHHDLLTRNGIYAELHRLQFGHQGLPGSRNAL